jgi:RimJ/RimL family protein N-acetyltransferase
MTVPLLVTDRLVLRPFVVDDLAELVEVHAEESFWWYPLRGAMTADETEAFLTRTIARYATDGFAIEAVIDRASEALIGWAGLAVPHFLPEVLPAVEVGWRLSGPYRGRGLATEAGRAAVDGGFTAGGLSRSVHIYEPENLASGRVTEHLGLVPFVTTRTPDPGAGRGGRGHRTPERDVGEAAPPERAAELLDRVAIHSREDAQHHLIRPGADGVEAGIAIEAGSPVLGHVPNAAVKLHGHVCHLALQP